MGSDELVYISTPYAIPTAINDVIGRTGVAYDPIARYGYNEFNIVNANVNDYRRSFSFVRNPYDRVVAAMESPRIYKPPYKDKQDKLNWFVNNFVLQEDNFERYKWANVMPMTDVRSKILDKGGNRQVQYIGRFENYIEDYKTITSILGLNNTIPRHIIETPYAYRDYYNAETYELVTDFYQYDLQIFDYRFTYNV